MTRILTAARTIARVCLVSFTMLAAPAVVSAQSIPSNAQSAAQVADALGAARLAYEDDMQKLRDAVLTEEARVREGIKYLENGPEPQRRGQRPAPKPSRPAAPPPPRRPGEVRQGDVWPEQLQDADEKKFAALRRQMLDAYATAIDAYDAMENEELREAVAGERRRFAQSADVRPWDKDMLFQGKGTMTIPAGSNPQIYPLKYAGDYRFQLRGRWLNSKKGVLELEVPVRGGDRAVVEPEYAADGSILVMLTVKDGVISPDLGVLRPVDVSRRVPSKNRDIVLRVREGTLEITMMTIKSLGNADATPAESQVRQGSPLRGTLSMYNGGEAKPVADGSVVSMTPTELVVRHTLPSSGAPVVWKFRRDADLLFVTSFELEGGGDSGYKLRKGRGLGIEMPAMPGQAQPQGRIEGGAIRWKCELVQPEPGRPMELTKGNVVTVELTVVK